jgi:hypothetical protein
LLSLFLIWCDQPGYATLQQGVNRASLVGPALSSAADGAVAPAPAAGGYATLLNPNLPRAPSNPMSPGGGVRVVAGNSSFDRMSDGHCWATQAACADAVLAADTFKLDLTYKKLSTRDVTFLATALLDPQVIYFF